MSKTAKNCKTDLRLKDFKIRGLQTFQYKGHIVYWQIFENWNYIKKNK